jgi:hypothetical protein
MVVAKTICGQRCVDYWKAGKLTVCVMYWRETGVDSPQAFYDILCSAVPSGTEMLGRKLNQSSDYCVLVGFPYRLGAWTGLRPPFVKACQEKGVSATVKVGFLCPVHYGGIWQDDVEFFIRHVRTDSLEIDGDRKCMFGSPLTVKLDDDDEVLPFLKSAGDMWK